jgi:hypothetical protein
MEMSMSINIADLMDDSVPVQVSSKGSMLMRALTLQEIVQVLLTYKDDFVSIYGEALSAEPNYAGILVAAPAMVADIIALSADAVGQEPDIMRLPASVQLTAIATVWRLSAPNPKELLASLSMVMAQLRELKPEAVKTLEHAPK